jgi:hypothetical protein
MTSVKRKAWLTVALACICAVGAPLYAKEAPDYSAFSDDKLQARYEKYAGAENPDHCNMLTPLLDEMAKRETFQPNIGNAKLLTAFGCAIDEGRYKDAFAASADVENIRGISFPPQFMLALAVAAEEYPTAASRIIKMAGSTNGEAFDTLDTQLLWQLSRGLVEAKNREMRLRMFRALADSPHWERLRPETRSAIAQETIMLDAENANYSRIKMLRSELMGPYPFIELLANRRLEPIWPELEEVAGPNLQKIADADVALKDAGYKANPADREAFQFYAHALHFAGKFEDAIALVRTFDHRPKAMLKATEDDLWAMNIEAYALDSLGRHGEADAVFDAMAAIPFEGERNSWLVNFVINRASRLVGFGQWQKGLDASMLAHHITEQSGSPYAKMLVRKARICALVNLNRTAEAAPFLVEAYERREDSYSTAAEAHLCAGEDDKAASIVLEALDNPDRQDDMAQDLQPGDFEIFYTGGILPSLRDRLRSRPEIDAAFNKIARDLPDRLIPVASLRRQQIAQAK